MASRLLSEQGAAGLTLRAVAREMGMAVSALYRYVDGHDGLLTLLLIDAFTSHASAVGSAIDTALRRAPHDAAAAWQAAAAAYRRWALRNPAAFGLAYGTPVPGYAAPRETIPAGTAVQRQLVRVLHAGAPRMSAADIQALDERLSATQRADMRVLNRSLGTDLAEGLLAAGVTGWVALEGAVIAEVFGHLEPVFGHPATWFTALMDELVARMRLPGALVAPGSGQPDLGTLTSRACP